MNRVTAHAATVREAIRTGQKADGSGPIGDVQSLEAGLALEAGEKLAYLRANSLAVQDGTLTADEGQTVYRALGEGFGTSNGRWARGTDVALKVTVTTLMGQLVGRMEGAEG